MMTARNRPGDTVLISACLLGEPCRFDGGSSHNSDLRKALEGKNLIPVCPEVAGGLPIPRPAAEIRGQQVVRQDGSDVTPEFERGAVICTEIGLQEGVGLAILKSRSPACGCGEVYNGSFTRTLRPGDGIFTESLKAAGIACISDEHFLDSLTHRSP